MPKRTCRECGAALVAQRDSWELCGPSRWRAFHNRKATRGAQLYDLVMAWRFDRTGSAAVGAQSLLCRIAAVLKAEDDRERPGLHSWDDVGRVRERNSHLVATGVGVNVAGNQRGNCAERSS